MKKFTMAFGGAFLFMQLFSIHAQDRRNPWALGFGMNILNLKTITDSYRATKELFIENNDNDVLFKTPFYLYGERYVGNKISVKLMLTINNQYNKALQQRRKPESVLQFHSADIKVKIRLLDPESSTPPFDPYLAVGGAYTVFKNTAINKTTNSGKIGVGIGFVYWLDKHIGINYQSDFHHNTLKDDFDYSQHSFGITVRFGKALD